MEAVLEDGVPMDAGVVSVDVQVYFAYIYIYILHVGAFCVYFVLFERNTAQHNQGIISLTMFIVFNTRLKL